MTMKTHEGAVERCLRGAAMTPVFALMLVILRLRAMFRGSLRVEAVTDAGDRFLCDLPDLIPLYLYAFGVWEPDVSAFIRSRLKDGDVFVDVGANIGYDTLLAWRAVRSNGAVAAIEASPVMFQQLQETCRANAAPAHVRLIHAAASDAAGTLSVYAGPRTNVGLTTTVPRAGMPKVAEVPARPLGELLTEHEIARTRFIKIDVEGGEVAVLTGLLSCIDRMPREVEIAMELSPLWWKARALSAADVLRPWVERGFNVYTVENNYWPWRYMWPKAVARPKRVREPLGLTRPVKRLDVVLSRVDAEEL
jgi:FkbM family methyltransferase